MSDWNMTSAEKRKLHFRMAFHRVYGRKTQWFYFRSWLRESKFAIEVTVIMLAWAALVLFAVFYGHGAQINWS